MDAATGDFCFKCGKSWGGAGECLECRELANPRPDFSNMLSWSTTYIMSTIRIYPHPDLKTVLKVSSLGHEAEHLSVYLDSNGMMNEAGGVAIAANQTGRQGRWWVMKSAKGACAIVNAKVDLLGPFVTMDEGCLSFPQQFAKVTRSFRVRVTGYRLNLKDLESGPFLNLKDLESGPFDEIWEGQDAQIAQHENDHLDGIMFIDYLSSPERTRVKGNLMRLKKQGKLR